MKKVMALLLYSSIIFSSVNAGAINFNWKQRFNNACKLGSKIGSVATSGVKTLTYGLGATSALSASLAGHTLTTAIAIGLTMNENKPNDIIAPLAIVAGLGTLFTLAGAKCAKYMSSNKARQRKVETVVLLGAASVWTLVGGSTTALCYLGKHATISNKKFALVTGVCLGLPLYVYWKKGLNKFYGKKK